MASKTFSSLGFEFDNLGIRVARITAEHKGRKVAYTVDAVEETVGDFTQDDPLAAGIAALADKLGHKSKDRVVACVSGKQIYITQLKFKVLPIQEMNNALRFEIRKNLPFESSGSAIDFQVLEKPDPEKNIKPTVMVTAVANSLLERLLKVISKAGLTPWIIDVLPVTVANAYWMARSASEPRMAHVMAHFAPDVCSLVIDGDESPFYNRNIYFTTTELYGKQAVQSMPDSEKTRRLDVFAEELRRSLSYYEKTYGISNFGQIYLLGQCAHEEGLRTHLKNKLGLPLDPSPLLERLGGEPVSAPARFDAALALAIRGREDTSRVQGDA